MMNMIFPIVSTLHTLAAVLWVGGMFFAHIALRPALMMEGVESRLVIWANVLPRFFVWVWLSVFILPVTGYTMVFFDFGDFASAGHHVELMHALAWVMITLYVFLFFKPYAAFKQAIEIEDFPTAGAHLMAISRVVKTNLILGIITIIAGVSGRFWG